MTATNWSDDLKSLDKTPERSVVLVKTDAGIQRCIVFDDPERASDFFKENGAKPGVVNGKITEWAFVADKPSPSWAKST